MNCPRLADCFSLPLLLVVFLFLLTVQPARADYNITISNKASLNGSWSGGSPDVWTAGASAANVSISEIQTRLNAATSVVITTAGGGSESGDIWVREAIRWSANSTVSLSAYRNIEVSANITASGNASGLTLTPGSGGSGGGYVLNNSAAITLSGAAPVLTLAGTACTVINDANALQNMGNLPADCYALGSDIDAAETALWNAGAGFEPVGNAGAKFTGIFEGLGHTIRGLYIYRPLTDYVGLFGYADSGAEVRNIGLVDSDITGGVLVGALVGENLNSTITNAYSTGSIVSIAPAPNSIVGGLAGRNRGTITNSYSTASATGNYDNAGGLVGINGSNVTISNCFSTGPAQGRWNVGGLAGTNYGTISYSYSTGTATVTGSNAGGLVGNSIGGTVTHSYWDSDTSGRDTSQGGTGLTTPQMMTQASFSGWDFAGVWRVDNGLSYPLLRSFLFSFIDQAGVQLSAVAESNSISVRGITSAAPISVTGGEYSVSPDGGQAWSAYSTTVPATVNLNDQVRVRQTSSASYGTTTNAVLTIGGVSDTFSVTTVWGSSCSAVPSSIVSWWKGEDNANDFMGMNNGTLQGGTTFAAGKVGQAFSFDGVDDAISVGMLNNTALSETMPFSITAWINSSDTQLYQVIAGNYMGESGGTGNYSVALYIYNGELVSLVNQRQMGGFMVATPLSTGWHMAGVTYDGTELVLYLDGIKKGSTLRNFSGASDNTRGWYIGNYSPQTVAVHGSNVSFSGLIDEIAIFNHALSAQELYATYAAGIPGICLDLTPDQFGFVDNTNASINETVEYQMGAITGFDSASPIAISCPNTVCEYQVNAGGPWTSAAGLIEPGSSVTVRTTAAGGIGTRTATLSIGGVTADFSVTVPGYDISGSVLPADKGIIQCPAGQVARGASASCTTTAVAGWYVEKIQDGGDTTDLLAPHADSYQYNLNNVLGAHTINATLNEFLVMGKAGQTTTYYDQADAAYADSKVVNEQILLRSWPGIFNPLTLNHAGSLFLGGGYGTGFVQTPDGYSSLGAPLTLAGGQVTVDRIELQ